MLLKTLRYFLNFCLVLLFITGWIVLFTQIGAAEEDVKIRLGEGQTDEGRVGSTNPMPVTMGIGSSIDVDIQSPIPLPVTAVTPLPITAVTPIPVTAVTPLPITAVTPIPITAVTPIPITAVTPIPITAVTPIPILVVPDYPAGDTGVLIYRNLDTNTGANIKAAPGQLYGWAFTNLSAATACVKLYDSASAPTLGSGTPLITFCLPALAAANMQFTHGLPFSAGIGITAAVEATDAGTTDPGTNMVISNIFYR